MAFKITEMYYNVPGEMLSSKRFTATRKVNGNNTVNIFVAVVYFMNTKDNSACIQSNDMVVFV